MQNVILRTPEGISFLEATTSGSKLGMSPRESPVGAASSLVWSSKGAFCAAMGGSTVAVLNGQTFAEEARLDIPELHAVAFSPRATYLITFQRPSKQLGNADKNLKLWEWRSGQVRLQLFQKSFSKDTWPLLQLTADEGWALHMAGAAVNAYDLADAQKGVARKLTVKGLGGFAVSPDPAQPVVAAFAPEGKGIPGFIGLWRLGDLSKSPEPPQPYCRRSFFRATSARLLWNAAGSAVLALTASETDASNKSYYGEQKLHFLAASGANDCMVALPKEGPVHDVQWSPSGDHFATVSGYMPAKTNLFSAKCRMLQDLGAGPYNLVRWNPQGRFLAVAGFGNLPGDIGIHEKLDDGTCKPLGAAKAEDGVSMEWSPDGRHLMTATTAPRMRVNNGIQLFRHTGGEALESRKLAVLFEATWQPQDPGAFADRPTSPKRGGSGQTKPATAAPIRSAGYLPPHARSAGGASSSGAHFSLAREQAPAGRLTTGPRPRGTVPGADPDAGLPAAGPKKPRKRGKGGGKGPAGGDGEVANGDAAVGVVTNGTPDDAAELAEEVSAMSVKPPDAGAADSAKRARNLKKKLTQIQQLKEKAKAGAALDPEQQAKLESEAGLLQELQSLEP